MSIRVLIGLPYNDNPVELSKTICHEVFRQGRRDPSSAVNQVHERVFAFFQRNIHRPQPRGIHDLHRRRVLPPSIERPDEIDLFGPWRKYCERDHPGQRLGRLQLHHLGLRAPYQADHQNGPQQDKAESAADSIPSRFHVRESTEGLGLLQALPGLH